MKLLKILGAAGASLIFMLVFTPAQAISSADVVLNLEGNPSCSSLGDNNNILEAKDTSPQDGDNSVTGPRNDGETQTIEYTIVDGPGPDFLPLLSWDIVDPGGEDVNPVNYVIIKAQGNAGAIVYHHGGIGKGAVTDVDEEARGNITAVSFCYGLTTGPVDTTEPPELPILTCEEANNLGGTIIGNCPLDSGGAPDPNQPRLLISLDLEADNFDVQSCTCNVAGGLPTCDPDLKVGDPGACIVTDPMDTSEGVNERVPVVIQGVETPSSYICYTIGGTRTCYGHF